MIDAMIANGIAVRRSERPTSATIDSWAARATTMPIRATFVM